MIKIYSTLLLILSTTIILFSQNNSLDFDGTDDYVEIASSPELTPDQFTIEAWIKSNNGGSLQSIFTKYNTNTSMISYGLVVLPDNTVQFGVYEAFTPILKYRVLITDDPVLTPNSWQHIAATFDLTTQAIKIYIDGIESPSSLDPSSIILSSIFSGSQPALIGNLISLDGTGRYFDGKIDEVRFWNSERTQTEISNNMNTELAGDESGLVSYYKADITDSTCDVEDCNSNENHGTRIGPNGSNNLPQFSSDVPSITDVACGAATTCNLLPVELIDFKGNVFSKEFILEWTTVNESNNLGFEIQKLSQSKDWETINFIEGQGTTSEFTSYKHEDNKPIQGVNYYRLKQVDLGGQFTFSKVISIQYTLSNNIRIYPNPVSNQFNISGLQEGTFKIYNNQGKAIKLGEFSNSSIDISNLPNSIYHIEINSGSEVFIKKVIKN